MHHVRGKDRNQSALFPVSVADLVPEDHPCRVIEAFVDTLELDELGFSNARQGRRGDLPTIPPIF